MTMIIDKLVLSSFLLVAVEPAVPDDPLALIPSDRIDLELKDAPVRDVMLLVQDIADRPVVLDPCVQGTLSLKLESVTLRTFLEVVRDSLSLSYGRDAEGALTIGCVEARPKSQRVDMSVVDVPLSDVLKALSRDGGISVESVACEGVSVDLSVSNAPASAVVHAISGQAGAVVEQVGERFSLRCDES